MNNNYKQHYRKLFLMMIQNCREENSKRNLNAYSINITIKENKYKLHIYKEIDNNNLYKKINIDSSSGFINITDEEIADYFVDQSTSEDDLIDLQIIMLEQI